jgi:site-specific recombinase XerD
VTEVLDHNEAEALLAAISTRYPTGARNYALLQLMLQTGIRCGEALAVRAADIRQEEWPNNGGTVKVWVLRLPRRATKGQQARQGIPMAPATREAIERWQEKRAKLGIRRGGPLFCTISRGTRIHGKPSAQGFEAASQVTQLRPGEPLDSRYVRKMVADIAKRAGIERRVHPHMLRHTALTNLYDTTSDLRMVQEVAGHTTSRMTERYTHVHPLAVARAMGAIEEE